LATRKTTTVIHSEKLINKSSMWIHLMLIVAVCTSCVLALVQISRVGHKARYLSNGRLMLPAEEFAEVADVV